MVGIFDPACELGLGSLPFQDPKGIDFQGPHLPMVLVMDVARIKIITSLAI